ncbi:MAG: transposase, partial [Balneolaceae bacterium]
ANFVADFVQKEYPNAIKIRLVLDNLNTHFPKSFYETFSKTQADQILKKIEFCYTPKHASWLNMAEIEINVIEKSVYLTRLEAMRFSSNSSSHG